jgi:hypothetical protein
MSELTIGQLIKIILGILVVIAVVVGLYFFFKNYILDYFKNMPGGNSSKFFMYLLK